MRPGLAVRVEPEPSGVTIDDLSADRQTDSAVLEFRRGMPPTKGLEHFPGPLGIHADSVVTYTEDDFSIDRSAVTWILGDSAVMNLAAFPKRFWNR